MTQPDENFERERLDEVFDEVEREFADIDWNRNSPAGLRLVLANRVVRRAGSRSISGVRLEEAGRPVTRGYDFKTADEVPGAKLSYKNASMLREELAEIDRAQIPGPDGRTR